MPARTPDPLDVAEPCAGSTLMHVQNVLPGARLRIEVPESRSLDYIVPPCTTTWDVPVEPLPSDKTVLVTMEICSFSTSTTVAIKGPVAAPEPTMVPKLYRCARAVAVKTTPGTYIEV